jgi:hypothetical protein
MGARGCGVSAATRSRWDKFTAAELSDLEIALDSQLAVERGDGEPVIDASFRALRLLRDLRRYAATRGLLIILRSGYMMIGSDDLRGEEWQDYLVEHGQRLVTDPDDPNIDEMTRIRQSSTAT